MYNIYYTHMITVTTYRVDYLHKRGPEKKKKNLLQSRGVYGQLTNPFEMSDSQRTPTTIGTGEVGTRRDFGQPDRPCTLTGFLTRN